MLVSGVRSSCEMAARNSVLAWLAALACASLTRSAALLSSSRRTPTAKITAAATSAAVSSAVSASARLRVPRQLARASSAPCDTTTYSG